MPREHHLRYGVTLRDDVFTNPYTELVQKISDQALEDTSVYARGRSHR